MPAFNKINFISSLAVASATRRFSEKSEFAGQIVHPNLGDLQTPPTRNEHIVATLAHSRGELGTGCNRAALGRRCEFAVTVVLMTLHKGRRVVAKCTNCHYASDSKGSCGAVPANAPPASDEAVQAERSNDGVEGAKEPQYAALPGHMRSRTVQPALQDGQGRATAEFTAENIDAVSAFSRHSFEVPSDQMSLTDPEMSSDMEEREKDREANLRNLHVREQTVRRVAQIGVEQALAEIESEREEYLASVSEGRSEGKAGGAKAWLQRERGS